MQSTLNAVFYDLDGTLSDSCDGIEWAAREAILNQWPERHVASMRHLIGPPIRTIFANALRENWNHETPAEELDALETIYRGLYDEHGCARCAAFPDVRRCLQQRHARGVQQFVVTNKPKLPTAKMLHALELSGFLRESVSPDNRAPRYADKGGAAIYLLQRYHLNRDRVLFVGDARDDALAAQMAGVKFVAAAWGYGNARAIEELPVWAVVENFAALDELLESHQSTLR